MKAKFFTRPLTIRFSFTGEQLKDWPHTNMALNDALRNVIGGWYPVNKHMRHIFMPIDCDVFELCLAISSAFKSKAVLKGMGFKVDIMNEMHKI